MALTDYAIQSAENCLSNFADNMNSAVSYIDDLINGDYIMKSPDYLAFVSGTSKGAELDKEFNDLCGKLLEVKKIADKLVTDTNVFIERQKQLNSSD